MSIWWSAAELIVGLILLEVDLWYLRVRGPGWLRVLAYLGLISVIVISHRRRKRHETADTSSNPLRPARAWGETAVATALLAALLLTAASLLRFQDETIVWPFQGDSLGRQLSWFLAKVGSALGQQLALQGFLWPLCLILLRRHRLAMFAAAGLFALVHLPCPALVVITGAGGLTWISLYRRTGDLKPLVASHIILATLAHAGLPDRLNYDMQVGIAALREQGRFLRLYDPAYRQAEANVRRSRWALKRLASEAYFQAQGGVERNFIRALYRDVLGRNPSQAELESWQGVLSQKRRGEVVVHFLASPENRLLRELAMPSRTTLASGPGPEAR